MHVARVVRKYQTKDGPRESVSHLLRRSFRAEGKIRHETLANVSALPEPALAALRAALADKSLLVAGESFEIIRSRPHGHLAAVATAARALGLPELLGPPSRARDIAYGLVLARVVRPASKLATLRWWADTTVVEDLGLAEVGTDEVYAAMDWLLDRQEAIEATLARRHLAAAANPAGTAYFDLTSAWMEGAHCPLAVRGYSRDGKKGLPQIEYGLLTDPAGRPVAVRVFAGNPQGNPDLRPGDEGFRGQSPTATPVPRRLELHHHRAPADGKGGAGTQPPEVSSAASSRSNSSTRESGSDSMPASEAMPKNTRSA